MEKKIIEAEAQYVRDKNEMFAKEFLVILSLR